jgi:hypothetical protein
MANENVPGNGLPRSSEIVNGSSTAANRVVGAVSRPRRDVNPRRTLTTLGGSTKSFAGRVSLPPLGTGWFKLTR